MPLIGTAGHVDHGKSTLVQGITGRDPDRWAVEKQRGLTIDLGFAWTTLPDGTEVSFVDVPGHERYLKNMLAGIETVDLALFVVAADEGWMPQSEEHLAVLDLLEVDRGVVALTKTDLAEDELVDLAAAEVADRLRGTSLEDVPIVPVSAATGHGLTGLLDALADMIPQTSIDRQRPRLWVDRSFTVAGAGTVVTGSLLDGSISVDDQVEVYPKRDSARVRGVQSHERSHQTIGPGRRVALNLAGLDHDEIERGHMIGVPGQWEMSQRFTVRFRVARYVDELRPKGAYQLHVGSAAHRVDITGLEGDTAVFQVDTHLPLMTGDRFILRDTGRRLVVAGGRVLDPAPPAGRRRAIATSKAIDPAAGPDEIAGALLAIRANDDFARLLAHSGGGMPPTGEVIAGRVVATKYLDSLEERAVMLVDEEHESHPLRPGLPMATLAGRLDVEPAVAEAVVARCDALQRIGPDVARVGHGNALDDDQLVAWERARTRLEESLAVPRESDLGLDPEIIHMKIRAGELIRVAPGLVYLPSQIAALREKLGTLGESFTVARFRDVSGLSRKYAVPILEWADKEGLTVRHGDVRSVR